MTSSLKEIGRSSLADLTVTGSFLVWPFQVTVSSVAPSARGWMTLPWSLARAGLAKAYLAWAVTSRVTPSGSVT